MKVFLSWSGENSRAVAEALREWLKYINSEIEPWMSDIDIGPGKRWSGEIAKELEATKFGVVCVTRDNQAAPWLNFEAAAIAKQVESSQVPSRIDLTVTDVKPPLGHFQATEMSESGILAVLESINGLCSKPLPNLQEICGVWWPRLKPKLDAARTSAQTAPVRDQQDLLEEILSLVRGWRVIRSGELVLAGETDAVREAECLFDEARRRDEARRPPESGSP